jgi:hypothetical protein
MRINSFRLAWLATAVAAGLVAVPPAPLASAATADACQSWNGSQPVSPVTGSGTSNTLAGVAGVSACDVWAVGYTQAGGKNTSRALIEHWTGGSWAVSPTPPLDVYTRLADVSAVSASNVWAAGFTTDASDHVQSLILHWNGIQWTRTDNPGPADSALLGITALSATDAWAVGQTGGSTSAVPLTLHWDGSRWTQKAVPPPAAGSGQALTSVSGVSGSDVWAQGNTTNGVPVLYHWNGSNWTKQVFAVPVRGQISGIAAVSASSVWAAGYVPGNSGMDQTLVMHWNGSFWAQTQVPNPGGSNFDNILTGMASSSASDVWASGDYFNAGSGQPVPFVLHYDGSAWAAASLPAPGGGDGSSIGAVAVSSPGQAFVAGEGPADAFASPVPVVPDVTGLSPDVASFALRSSGLAGPPGALGHTTNCPGSSSGKIVATDPAAGLREPFGLPVSLTVCDTPATVPVPNVMGFDDQSAQNTIRAAGLTVGSVTMEADCSASFGDVLRQNPGGGTTAATGSPVSLVESTGRQANGKPCVID